MSRSPVSPYCIQRLITERRVQKGLSRAELAERADVDEKVLKNLERHWDKTEVDFSLVCKVFNALDLYLIPFLETMIEERVNVYP